ncbi:VWA domain-containing protein [Anabaena sp. UHCC 0204]|uniref:VWA domain-containing protein n=1 Tax=Anabaena sp. UHCC 0204 TaxID=2590009 RepID=UPI0014481014|nr:VWA domain-containing protein [Anabaena sp. UHCC 0204]MTJ09557.1 VWA domain-containing protein [Anabaena sp. UHCC 0204]
MSEFNPQDLMIRVFMRLRQNGFQLGVGEFLAAEKAVLGGFGKNSQELGETLKILWCHSISQQNLFDDIWESLQNIATSKQSDTEIKPQKEITPETLSQHKKETPENTTSPLDKPPEPKPEPKLESLPVRAPFMPMEMEDNFTLQTYYPLSRRSMVYGWRYLRRLVADGTLDILDINATIQKATYQGFYIAPVYRRRERNNAHLLLLIDQNGSMTPFHRFSRDLVETAVYESSIPSENVQVFYFQNVPVNSVYKDIYLTEPIALDEVLKTCDNETSILIVSDAGAARGYRILNRIRATSRFIFKLQRYTYLIAWLNPMSEERWFGSSAEIIANLIPMYQMDNNGLSNAIDILRGQTLKQFY